MSAAQLLSGSRRMAEMTSLTVTAWNSISIAVIGAARKVGGEPRALAARTASTLSIKNLWNWSTLIAALAGTRPRPSSRSTERHCCDDY